MNETKSPLDVTHENNLKGQAPEQKMYDDLSEQNKKRAAHNPQVHGDATKAKITVKVEANKEKK